LLLVAVVAPDMAQLGQPAEMERAEALPHLVENLLQGKHLAKLVKHRGPHLEDQQALDKVAAVLNHILMLTVEVEVVLAG
jgi:hypothetical protein